MYKRQPERRSSGAAGRRPGTRGTAARKKGARPGGKKGKGRLVLPIMAGMAAAFAVGAAIPVSYTHLRAHETGRNLVCRLLLEKKNSKPSSA